MSSRLAVGFAGWILPWYESEIGGDLASGRRADESFQTMAAGRSLIQPEGPHASMTTRSILWFLKRGLR